MVVADHTCSPYPECVDRIHGEQCLGPVHLRFILEFRSIADCFPDVQVHHKHYLRRDEIQPKRGDPDRRNLAPKRIHLRKMAKQVALGDFAAGGFQTTEQYLGANQ